MTQPLLTLEGVTRILPDGRILFSDLDERFDRRATGLVGRNGVGKSVLARILAGHEAPTSGRCRRAGTIHYLPQQVAPAPGDTVADLAGIAPALEALARIEAGSSDPSDFERVGERWTLRAELDAALQAQGLPAFDPATPADRLSGGQAMRVALAGAWLSDADLLILDEPGNHLDLPARQRLLARLRDWPRGLLLVSHDRALLRAMQRIVELTPEGLRSHGDGYDAWLASREQDAAAAGRALEQARAARDRERRALVEQHEREQRRQARGRRERGDANQAPILLDRQQQRSERSAGRRSLLRERVGASAEQRVREAAARVDDDTAIAMFAPLPPAAAQRCVAELDQVRLPHAPPAQAPLSLRIGGTRRIGVTGGNGLGKSTLLRVLAGQWPPARGGCRRHGPVALLDQALSLLRPDATVLDQLIEAAPDADVAGLRTRLALLGLDAARVAVPVAALSGGERLKAALACVLYAALPPSLLLLDEPDNHLDLASREALERMLSGYPGALVVVSHDREFLDRLRLDTRLDVAPEGWQVSSW
ncbi:ATP-binding cassette domain-containing protein [Xanthomonas sp. XNM01]|uniref:ATP-binding cassette domain-containing protein n=1 Tax=Xanthomonas sp. XNM01 TaxID=2769289 RepID=UPI00177B738B|nr:ATP-binding cassette domain-containing protein [Xanthomonas sp. XNM01]MBD9367706.1 ABC-F family ATP-binding cassette domain-containing protein [Xanthomonas sp. XNM01]